MTTKIFLQVRPIVHRYLNEWKQMAEGIPDPELRKQALASIRDKTFHCEGGSIYGLLAGKKYPEAIRFIVAYQTISDYLDNLCDRSTSLDPDDFRALHEAMIHALSLHAPSNRYYHLREEADDGGYLDALIKTCQDVLKKLPAYEKIAPAMMELAGYYCNLQINKHVTKDQRVDRLKSWFEKFKNEIPAMSWYEFSACTGSTLGIFCLVAHAFHHDLSEESATEIKKAYFPWVQGLHILLDYLIDQEEDRLNDDLNFCFFYRNDEEIAERLQHFYQQADKSIAQLPDARFHSMINHGLIGIYLADKKAHQQKDVWKTAKKMIRTGGLVTWFFYLHCWVYRRLNMA
ncbi:MAG: tetraprenyl-beta-curcumene synthase family protein [Deltaproteobacteria bacterium]|nr:tetraprenyl-beta-curcumene synthase family protein [Deltaproteobacteria bacterium]